MMKLGVLIFLIFGCSYLFAQKENVHQVNDSIPLLLNKKEKSDTTKKHPFVKAMILSAVLPGAGQVYNSIQRKKPKNAYWKVPLIYAGLGATGYFMVRNHLFQKSIKEEYRFRESTDFTEIGDNRWSQYDEASLITLQQKYLNNRDYFILGMGLVYLLQVADAAVEAHFINFDVSEDLSFQVRPTFMAVQPVVIPSVGIKLALNFKK